MIDAFFAAPLTQTIGLCGTLAGISWPLFRSRFGILAVQVAAGVLFGLHYALLGAGTGSVMNLLSALQALAAIPLGSRPNFRYIYLALLPVIAVGAIATWHGLPSLFAAAGLAFISLSRYQTAVAPLRVCMALALPCWFGHNLLVGSVPGMISDVAGMTLNGWMLARGGGLRPATVPAVVPGMEPAAEGAVPPSA